MVQIASKHPALGANPICDHEIDLTHGRMSRDKQVLNKQPEYKSCLSITPIGKGLLAGIVIKPRGPNGNAGFSMVTRWPVATAMRFSSDQATALGYDGEATSEAAWKREAIGGGLWTEVVRTEWEFGGKNQRFCGRSRDQVRCTTDFERRPSFFYIIF